MVERSRIICVTQPAALVAEVVRHRRRVTASAPTMIAVGRAGGDGDIAAAVVDTAAMTALEIETAIYAAHTRAQRFPAHWTDEERNSFLSDYLPPLVDWVTEEYDNIIDRWINWGHRHHGRLEELEAGIVSERDRLLCEALNPQPHELPTPDLHYFE